MADKENKTPIIVYGLMAFLFGAFSALTIVGWQIYGYLRSGDWVSISIIDVLNWLEIAWAKNPQSWFGLYELLTKMSFSLTIFIASLFIFWLASAIDK